MRRRANGKAEIGLDTTVFDAVIEKGDVASCRRLGRELAAFLADPSAPVAERDAVVPAVLRTILLRQRLTPCVCVRSAPGSARGWKLPGGSCQD